VVVVDASCLRIAGSPSCSRLEYGVGVPRDRELADRCNPLIRRTD
jgi:hypothetical protein